MTCTAYQSYRVQPKESPLHAEFQKTESEDLARERSFLRNTHNFNTVRYKLRKDQSFFPKVKEALSVRRETDTC